MASVAAAAASHAGVDSPLLSSRSIALELSEPQTSGRGYSIGQVTQAASDGWLRLTAAVTATRRSRALAIIFSSILLVFIVFGGVGAGIALAVDPADNSPSA